MHKSNCFDTARLVAAMMVLVSHHYALSGQPEPYLFGFESAGGIAVIIFFSISGYLISKSAIRSDSFIDFMAKRARRIFPALVPCSILTYFLFGWILNDFSAEYFSHDIVRKTISSIFMSQAPDADITSHLIHAGINGSLWTLPLEFLCYIITGVAVALLKNGKAFIVILLVFVSLSLIGSVSENRDVMFSIPLWLYPLRGLAFFFGATMAMYEKSWNVKITVVSLLAMYAYASYGKGIDYTMTCYILVSFSTIAICTSVGDPLVKGRFDYSYGVYIYAFPVQQVVINTLHMGFYPSMLLSAVTVLFLSHLSWNLVEKRFLTRSSPKLSLD
ncbi:acyltransferase [Shigella flexneri]|nr:acyltransferase [Shigella flexneri]EHF3741980.1 acyltransferase [Shigella flexneri]